MSDNPQAEMLEAMRLTRAGRLTEATVLLQRRLAGVPPRDATTESVARWRVPEALRSLFGRPAPPVRGRAAPAGRPAPHLVPEGGQFLARLYTGQAGTRGYRLYVPSGYHGRAVPLVVMLHGCKQSPEDFAAGTRMNAHAEERTCLVAYPAQAISANSSKCWNWFDPRHQQRGHGEASLIAGVTGQVMREFSVDLRRIYVAGLSAGGALAAIMASTYPDLYAAVGVHSGLARGAARDVPSAFAAMRQGKTADWNGAGSASPADVPRAVVPAIVFHGDHDRIVHPSNADQVLRQLGAGTKFERVVQHGRVPDGHTYTRTLYADASGRLVLEAWTIHGAGHAWSGGSSAGSYTDPQGPDAAQEMMRFFLEHPQPHIA